MPGLLENVMLDVGAHEPWPNDVLLFQPYPIEQILLPDNANCLATQAFLHMCGLPFKVEHRSNAEFMSPSGKVPFIKCGAFLVSELEPIVQFVGNKGISLTEDLDAEQKSDLRAYMSLIFSVLMNAELYICWCDKRTYNDVTKVRNGSVFPWPLNYFQTWSKKSAVIRKLKLHGWHQKTLGSVYQEVQNCCQALSERLEGKEFFFGSKPTELDALIFGNIFSIFLMSKDIAFLFLIIKKYPNLTNHCSRICQAYFDNEDLNFEKSKITQENFFTKNLNSKISSNKSVDNTNESKNNNNKPIPALKDQKLSSRQPRASRKTRFNDVIPQKQESYDSSPERCSQLANVKSIDSLTMPGQIEISAISDSIISYSNLQTIETDNNFESSLGNKPIHHSTSSLNNKIVTELTYFNSNLQTISQSTFSDFSEMYKNESSNNLVSAETPDSYNKNKNDELSLHDSPSSLDHIIRSNNDTSDLSVTENKDISISTDSAEDKHNIQADQHLNVQIGNSISDSMDTIIPDNKYNSISLTNSNELQSLDCSNNTYESDSKYDLVSLNSLSSHS